MTWRLGGWSSIIWVGLVAALLLLAIDPGEALARVGGGDSYGGGGGGGGGYGGGGGDDGAWIILIWYIVRFLIWLTIEYPIIGIPLDIVFVVVVILVLRQKSRSRGTGRRATPQRQAARLSAQQRAVQVNRALDRLHEEDQNFSRPLLLDFVQLLYTRAHEHRGSGKLDLLAPYLSKAARKQLAEQARPGDLSAVEGIVIGASRILKVGSWGGARRALTVEFEANYTERRGSGEGASRNTLYTRERWIFSRKAGVLSQGPDSIAALRCPSCGSAVELATDGTCPYCHNIVDRGDFHWNVAAIQVLARRPRDASEVHRGGGAEVGTQLPTVVHPGLASQLRALKVRDAEFDLQGFKSRVGHVFGELQQAWTSLAWERARAFETDHLYTTHRYWIEQFEAAGARNVLDRIELGQIELAKVEQDAYFDALTVRVFASMLDYTEDADGQLLSGSRTKPRSFSEYWTFIRRAGRGSAAAAEPDSCPSCGAGLKVSQAGVCEYCGTKVVTGEFGWVLSSIEQDEVYGG